MMRLLYVSRWFLLLLLLVLGGCTQVRPPVTIQPAPLPVFPPQKAMESGDYAGFLTENQKALETCSEPNCREVALFNLGFIHAYSKSPYCNPGKALRYFDRLAREYPQSPWAYQAKSWVDLIKKSLAAEDRQHRLKKEVKTKDTTINELQMQIQRSRDIDVQMDRKEREILQ